MSPLAGIVTRCGTSVAPSLPSLGAGLSTNHPVCAARCRARATTHPRSDFPGRTSRTATAGPVPHPDRPGLRLRSTARLGRPAATGHNSADAARTLGFRSEQVRGIEEVRNGASRCGSSHSVGQALRCDIVPVPAIWVTSPGFEDDRHGGDDRRIEIAKVSRSKGFVTPGTAGITASLLLTPPCTLAS